MFIRTKFYDQINNTSDVCITGQAYEDATVTGVRNAAGPAGEEVINSKAITR